jgi:hypothetical protein
LLQRLPSHLLSQTKVRVRSVYDIWLRRRVARTWLSDRNTAVPHGLSKPLIVSLTSYPLRYGTLGYTLKSLLAQSTRADQTILWIAHRDKSALPENIRALEKHGLTISYCDDVRSHKKYTYTFKAFPDAFIVTADDDAFYWRKWLEELVAAYDPAKREIPCHRAHRIIFKNGHSPDTYSKWNHNISDAIASPVIFPTGLGGVLYSLPLLHPDVVDIDRAMALTPTADDIWLFWMARRAGTVFKKVGPRRRFHNWTGTQEASLYQANVLSQQSNDRQIVAMIEAYGWPV